MEITNNSEKMRYEILIEGELAGFADYIISGDTVTFRHTEIFSQFGGRGLGSSLVEFALNDITSLGKFVAPVCPFVSKAIAKNPEKFLKLVPESERNKYALALDS
jgi:predicted GNAT family acetyltransferase